MKAKINMCQYSDIRSADPTVQTSSILNMQQTVDDVRHNFGVINQLFTQTLELKIIVNSKIGARFRFLVAVGILFATKCSFLCSGYRRLFLSRVKLAYHSALFIIEV
jgi:hypothetical protein